MFVKSIHKSVEHSQRGNMYKNMKKKTISWEKERVWLHRNVSKLIEMLK